MTCLEAQHNEHWPTVFTSNLPEYYKICQIWTHNNQLTAIVFSLIPPTGRIFPIRETSPVIATFCRIGTSFARDRSAVTIVQPALGPSFGVAPYKPNFKCLHTFSTMALNIKLWNTLNKGKIMRLRL